MKKQMIMKMENGEPIFKVNALIENSHLIVAFVWTIIFGILGLQEGIVLFFVACVVGFLLGLIVGNSLRNGIYQHKAVKLRNICFLADEIPDVQELFERLQYLNRAEMLVSMDDKEVTVSSRNIMYDIEKVSDTQFKVLWHKSIARALFGYQTFHSIYHAVNHDMAQIAYAVTAACSKDENSAKEVEITASRKTREGLAGMILSITFGVIGVGGLILAALFIVSNGSNNEYVQQVKTASPYAYPDKTYGEAFDSFFKNPKWKYFEGENGEDVVEFTGKCTYHDTEVEALIQFLLNEDDNTVEVGAFSLNDVPQTELMTYGLITAVFEDESIDSAENEEETETDAETEADEPEEETNIVNEDNKEIAAETEPETTEPAAAGTDNGYFDSSEYSLTTFYLNATDADFTAETGNTFVSSSEDLDLYANLDPEYNDDGTTIVGFYTRGWAYENSQFIVGFDTFLEFESVDEYGGYILTSGDGWMELYLAENQDYITLTGGQISDDCWFIGDFRIMQ
jgi:hypothetical protein